MKNNYVKPVNNSLFNIIGIVLMTMIFINSNIKAQEKPELSFRKNNNAYSKFSEFNKISSTSGLPPMIAFAAVFLVINPELVIENKKVYFGLTKEFSIGKYPYGRLAFEYSYIFRNFSKNHFRFSYNQDFMIPSKGDFFAPCISAGAGYFTDTDHKGLFVQGSAGIILPLPTGIFEGVYAYIKGRHTFVKGAENSNITDISIGMSILLYY